MIYNPIGSRRASRLVVGVGWVDPVDLPQLVSERQRLLSAPYTHTHVHTHAQA